MAIYKPRRSRWPLVAGVTVSALILGFVAGVLVAGNKSPDLHAAAASIAEELRGSAQLLEVTSIEYEEAIKPGASEAEFQGSLENLARARARYEVVAPALAVIDATRVDEINRGFDELRAQMDQRTPNDQVARAIHTLEAKLINEPGI